MRQQSHNNVYEPAVVVDSLQAEQIKLLYSNLPVAISINAVLALILASVQSSLIPPYQLYAWLAVFGVVLLSRIYLFISWKRSGVVNKHTSQHWLFWFRISVIATGIAWGVGGVILSPAEDILHQLYISFVLAGLCAGAITSLAVDRISTIGFLLPTLLPHMTYFILQEGATHSGMSIMILLFLLYIAASARQIGLTLHENFRLRIKAVENESHFRSILQYSPIAAHIINRTSHKVEFANQSYITLLGVDPNQIIGIDPVRYYARLKEYAEILEQLDKGQQVTNVLLELAITDKVRTTKWVLASYLQINYQNEPAVLGWLYDITDRKRAEEQIQFIAYHDTLTGLPNRMLLSDRIQQAISTADRDQINVALIFIDLDEFKPINDNHGHNVGDQLLKTVAGRIRKCLRKSDSVARFGGDEFVVLLPEIDTRQDALEVAEKIHSSLNQAFDLAGLRLSISSSMGVAIYPEHANDEKQFIHNADIAMYYAKHKGRNNIQLYKNGMREFSDEPDDLS